MEWIVFRGSGMPSGYVIRVWAFADLIGHGLWNKLEWLNHYQWLAMPIDYALEGLIAFFVGLFLSLAISKFGRGESV